MDAKVVEVADRVFAYAQYDGSWWVNTTGFVAGAGEVLANTPPIWQPTPDWGDLTITPPTLWGPGVQRRNPTIAYHGGRPLRCVV